MPIADDQELIALGERLDAAVAACKAQEPAYFAADAGEVAALQAARQEGRFDGLDGDARRALLSELNAPFKAARETSEHLHEAYSAVAKEVVSISPTTIGGIKVIARGVRFGSRELWEKPERREPNEDIIVALVDGVLGLDEPNRDGPRSI